VKINGGGSAKPVSPTRLQDVTLCTNRGHQGAVTPALKSDKIDITSLSAQLAQLEKALNAVGEVDVARVDAIKQAISEGRFRIDSEVVAEKLLQSVREFLANQKA